MTPQRPIILAILDGWGIGERHASNPIYVVNPPTFDMIRHTYLAGSLQASGIAVGLPWGEAGNSEVGHLTLGAGKVIYQYYPRITLSIERGDFFTNPALVKAFEEAEKNKKTLHIIGLLSSGNVHSSLTHLETLLRMAHERKTDRVALHLFTDGKDSPPQSFPDLFEQLKDIMKTYDVGRIASISGRYYALDREGKWKLSERVFQAMTNNTSSIGEKECIAYVKNQYAGEAKNDEFIEPITVTQELSIQNGDSLIFFNFREDGVKQIAEAFTRSEFPHFKRSLDPRTLTVATFTEYSASIPALVAFPREIVDAPLGKILADHGYTQLRIAETKKYAHVTYFFNGLREEPFSNEHRVIVPSKSVAREDDAPDMAADDITARVVNAIENGGFQFVLVNYANADIIAHTGNYVASHNAIRAIDRSLDALVKTVRAYNAILILTSDHGNIERMFDPTTGRSETHHDPNPVPFYLIGNGFEKIKNDVKIHDIERGTIGTLADVAPTILDLLDIPKPNTMTGQSLMSSLR